MRSLAHPTGNCCVYSIRFYSLVCCWGYFAYLSCPYFSLTCRWQYQKDSVVVVVFIGADRNGRVTSKREFSPIYLRSCRCILFIIKSHFFFLSFKVDLFFCRLYSYINLSSPLFLIAKKINLKTGVWSGTENRRGDSHQGGHHQTARRVPTPQSGSGSGQNVADVQPAHERLHERVAAAQTTARTIAKCALQRVRVFVRARQSINQLMTVNY